MRPAKNESTTPEVVEQNRPILIVQVVWGCYAFNASPQEAAKQIVNDLYQHLLRGGTLPVRIEDSEGTECELEVGAQQ